MSLVLRLAGPADIPAVVQLMNRAFRGTGPDASWNTEAVFMDGDRTCEGLLRAELQENPDAFLLVVENETGQAMQGCVWLAPLSSENWYLGSLTIDPLLQKCGLGRTLLDAAEQWAAERGATRIQMTVVNVRDTLIAWYQRRGYRRTGETRPFPYRDSRFGVPRRDDLAFVVLAKQLTATLSTSLQARE